MSTKNELFFAELLSEKAAKWSAGVAFDRSNGLPLDQWSVFQTKAAATEYLSNSKAYPGQVIAYAEDNGEMTACVLSQNAEGTALTLKPIGIIPMGDGKTVDVSATGVITLKGAANATAGQQPRIVNNGTAEEPKLELEWYTPDNSTVAGLQDTVGGLVETINGVEGDESKPGLKAEVNALKIADIGLAADIKEIADDYVKASDAVKTYETIENVGKVNKALTDYIDANDKALAGVKATAEAARTETEVNDQIDAKISALNLATTYEPIGAETRAKGYVDQKFTDANLDQYTTEQEVKDIVDKVITDAVDGDTLTSLTELVDYLSTHGGEYTALLGEVNTLKGKPSVDITSGQISNWDGEVGAKELAQGVKNVVDANKTTWDKAATALQAADLADYAKTADVVAKDVYEAYISGKSMSDEALKEYADGKANAAQSAAETVATNYNNAMDARVQKLEQNEAGYATTAQVDTARGEAIAAAAEDATEKADQALADAKADTAAKLANYQTKELTTAEIAAAIAIETAARVEALRTADAAVKALDARVDSVSAQANKGITDAQAAATAAAAAQTTADGAVIKADANATAIGNHATRLSTLEAFKTSHEAEFSGLVNRVGSAEGAINTLTNNKADKSIVNGIDERVAQIELDLNGKPAEEGSEKVVGLKERVEANATEIVALDGRVTTLETDVTTLKNKEDKDTTYTFANGTEGTFTVTPKNGSAQIVDTGAKAYADAEIKKVTDVMATDEEVEDIRAALAKTISDETSRADTAEKALDAAIKAEAAAREAADNALDARLDTVEAFWAAAEADGTDKNVIDTLKEIQEYITSDETGASAMAASIKQNADAIATIYTPAVEEVKDENGEVITEAVAASGVLVDEIARIEKEVNDLKAVDHAATHEATLNSAKSYTDAALETAKKYADDEIDKLPVVDNDTIKVNDSNKMYVNRVSVACLDDTGVELILCGGNA